MTTGPVDSLLADRYRLVERIATGGMGEVWRAQDVLLGRDVAVKTLKEQFVGDPDFRARFRAEARHAGRLGHPGIASVYDFGETDGSAWLVMELVEGEPLSSLLRREGALSVDRTLDLVAQAAAALQAAHEGGVVHRDVKPGNLLVRPDGVLKVTDFGIASATDAVPLTQTGSVVGTAYYLSPEQAAGRTATPASDVYSLGVVAYECLAGRRPFPGDNPVAVALAHLQAPVPPLRAAVPQPVRELVLRALAKDPADRFPGAADMGRRAAALRAALEGGPWVQEEDGGLAALEVSPPPAVAGLHVAAHPVVDTDPAPVAPTEPGAGADREALAPTGLLEVPFAEPLRRPARRTPGSRPRSSRSAVSLVAVLLAVLAVGLGLRAGAAAPAEPSLARGLGAVARPEPVTVPVDPADYLGRPAAQVRAALAGLGLVPRLTYDGSGRPVGTVSGVEPAGRRAVGSGVVVHVVPAPRPAVEQPAPAAVAPVAPAAEPKAKGRGGTGKGKGKGKR